MNIGNIITSACALTVATLTVSADIISVGGSTHVFVGDAGQSDGLLASLYCTNYSPPGAEYQWGGQAFVSTQRADHWRPDLNAWTWTAFEAHGDASSWGEVGVYLGSSVDMTFTLDAVGLVSLQTSGAGAMAEVAGYALIRGNNGSWAGVLGPGTYHLYAGTVGPGSFAVSVPSLGGPSLGALAACGLLRRRRRS